MPTVVFIEAAAMPGGSSESLLQLLQALNRRRWTPHVLTFARTNVLSAFAAAGATTECLDIARPNDLPRGRVTEAARRNPLTQQLQRSGPGRRVYHGVGFTLKFLRHSVPQARHIAARLRALDADLVHCNGRVGFDHIGILAAALAGRPCVVHVRDWDALGPVERLLLHAVDHLIYISKAIAADHRRQGVAPERGTVILNALDLAAYRARAAGAESMRREFGWDEDVWLVGLVGRVEAWKGQRIFLQALSQLRADLPQLRALIVGASSPQSSGYWDELQQMTRDLDLTDIVRFTGYRADTPRVVGALDVLAHCSTTPEPFGRVLIEAGALAKPVVAANAGGVPEIVVDGVTGLLVGPGDPTALATALRGL
ncbi:MAG TPA: hypothetical protein DEP84_25510, partial [Chloroflexi bacterium]|nr:hypothetical protein [Chloroflexota bacterium]